MVSVVILATTYSHPGTSSSSATTTTTTTTLLLFMVVVVVVVAVTVIVIVQPGDVKGVASAVLVLSFVLLLPALGRGAPLLALPPALRLPPRRGARRRARRRDTRAAAASPPRDVTGTETGTRTSTTTSESGALLGATTDGRGSDGASAFPAAAASTAASAAARAAVDSVVSSTTSNPFSSASTASAPAVSSCCCTESQGVVFQERVVEAVKHRVGFRSGAVALLLLFFLFSTSSASKVVFVLRVAPGTIQVSCRRDKGVVCGAVFPSGTRLPVCVAAAAAETAATTAAATTTSPLPLVGRHDIDTTESVPELAKVAVPVVEARALGDAEEEVAPRRGRNPVALPGAVDVAEPVPPPEGVEAAVDIPLGNHRERLDRARQRVPPPAFRGHVPDPLARPRRDPLLRAAHHAVRARGQREAFARQAVVLAARDPPAVLQPAGSGSGSGSVSSLARSSTGPAHLGQGKVLDVEPLLDEGRLVEVRREHVRVAPVDVELGHAPP